MRMFLLFGLTIVITVVVAGATYHLTGGTSWHQDLQRAGKYVGGQFGDVWLEPSRRDAFAASLASELNLGVELQDAEGRSLGEFGPDCDGHTWDVPVDRDGRVVGLARICAPSRGSHWGSTAAIVAVCIALWAFSGLVARHLMRPVERVVNVTRRLGAGDFSARVAVSRRGAPEIRVLGQTINDMADRIEKQMRDQRELLAAVSHEIRTPLTRLRIITEMVRDGCADEKALRDMDAEIAEIDELIGQLLASSRLDFGALQLRSLRACDVAIEAVERAGLTVDTVEDKSDNAPFEGDPTLIARALSNLLGNAIKHGRAVSLVRVEASPSCITFSVCDEGPGFPPDDLARVFEPFFRAESAVHEPGLGLGLALVHRIALAHGGTARAENTPLGACVQFSVARDASVAT